MAVLTAVTAFMLVTALQNVDDETEVVEPEAQAQEAPLSTPDYILSHSRYGWKAVCVSRIETGSWTAFYNRTPVGREHAQGYFGWLPSTFYGIAQWGQIMDLDAEIDAFDRMLDAHRGAEFYGLGGYAFRDGSGPCYRR